MKFGFNISDRIEMYKMKLYNNVGRNFLNNISLMVLIVRKFNFINISYFILPANLCLISKEIRQNPRKM